ncbi:HPr kinase/phosphorylase [Tateyamaria armeniaca]|uniref:HPr kinase/phosphorylase n=1 Tax=Tateyamaria armeniaca TaxID=2518930 RepID=A0ABW8US39_9RHOB
MAEQTRLHATSVAFEGKGVLITGASGRGKSSLALQLMALGCTLVSDDQTELIRKDNAIWAAAPAPIRG